MGWAPPLHTFALRVRVALLLLDRSGSLPGPATGSPACRFFGNGSGDLENVLETGGGNQRQMERRGAVRICGISREWATSRNHLQSPNPPYKQEVAGSSPAPPITSRRSHRFVSVALNVSSYTRI